MCIRDSTSSKPMDDKMVEWLFRNPLSDGGTFTGVADIVSKYGLVPVSYTHLDVYKRQGLNHAVLFISISRNILFRKNTILF